MFKGQWIAVYMKYSLAHTYICVCVCLCVCVCVDSANLPYLRLFVKFLLGFNQPPKSLHVRSMKWKRAHFKFYIS